MQSLEHFWVHSLQPFRKFIFDFAGKNHGDVFVVGEGLFSELIRDSDESVLPFVLHDDGHGGERVVELHAYDISLFELASFFVSVAYFSAIEEAFDLFVVDFDKAFSLDKSVSFSVGDGERNMDYVSFF